MILNRNLAKATEGLDAYVRKHLLERISRENASIIVDYILAMRSEIRVSDNYRLNTIVTLKKLAEHDVNKSFKDMGRQDIINFLDIHKESQKRKTQRTSGWTPIIKYLQESQGSSSGCTILTIH